MLIRGATLAGLACAARLARLGHRVTVDSAGYTPDPLPEVVLLPAAWRDLFKKSGAHLVTALNKAGLELAEAPPAHHRFSDGSQFHLPAERGAQFHAISAAFGQEEAARWRDLLDDLMPVWAAYRRHALEGTEPVRTSAQRDELWLTRTVADAAARLTTPLAEIVLSVAPTSTAPGLAALPLLLERTFGRWQLTDADGSPQPTDRLVDLLRDRLAERGVRVVDQADGPADIDCRPTPARPSRWWRRPPAPHTAAAWLASTPIDDGGQLRASSSSPAGDAPWAQLGSAALAVYAAHERATGEDCRPTNKDFRLPRLADPADAEEGDEG